LKKDEKHVHSREILHNDRLPVLLTCPHGGRVEFTPTREDSVNCGPGQFRKRSDTNTIEVTEGIALNILRMANREVYRTIGVADRTFIDFNREPECAYATSSDQFGKHLYDEYHDNIAKTIKKMRSRNSQGLCFLFDIHGTDNTDAQLYFGTDARTNPNKSTICGLLERNPRALWDANTGLLKLLQDKGYSTIPRNIHDQEHPSFDGGLTVTKYGGCDVNPRVEAIQCEITSELRERSNRLKLTVDLAECILKFIKPYTPAFDYV
jgi:N-formylglutamate amidohydrolase